MQLGYLVVGITNLACHFLEKTLSARVQHPAILKILTTNITDACYRSVSFSFSFSKATRRAWHFWKYEPSSEIRRLSFGLSSHIVRKEKIFAWSLPRFRSVSCQNTNLTPAALSWQLWFKFNRYVHLYYNYFALVYHRTACRDSTVHFSTLKLYNFSLFFQI